MPAQFKTRAMDAMMAKKNLVRFAPMGDPVEIKVRGYNLTLRKHEAEQILVKANSELTL